jgi:hypothetical protein
MAARTGVTDDPAMTERPLPAHVPRSPAASIAGAFAAAIVILVLGSIAIHVLAGLVGLAIPIVLVAGGVSLVARDHRFLGWSAVGLGGVMLLGHLPLLLLVTAVAAVAWSIGHRS